jgi:hypothetical protein
MEGLGNVSSMEFLFFKLYHLHEPRMPFMFADSESTIRAGIQSGGFSFKSLTGSIGVVTINLPKFFSAR